MGKTSLFLPRVLSCCSRQGCAGQVTVTSQDVSQGSSLHLAPVGCVLGVTAPGRRSQQLRSHTFPVPMFHFYPPLPFLAPVQTLHRLGRKSPNPWHRAWQLGAFIHLLCWNSTEGQLEGTAGRKSPAQGTHSSRGGLRKPQGQEKPGESSRDQSGTSEVSHGDIQGASSADSLPAGTGLALMRGNGVFNGIRSLSEPVWKGHAVMLDC